MACNQIIASSICNNLSAVLECLERIYQGLQKDITIQLVDLDGYPLNLDDVSQIQILLYDNRGFKIAKYYYPDYLDTSYTYEQEVDEIDWINDVWVDGLDINILQMSISTSSDFEDEYVNKGKISFSINEEVSNYLLIGSVYIDVKVTMNNSTVYIIKCLQIGKIEKNEF